MPWHDPTDDAALLASRAPGCTCTAIQLAEVGCDCEPEDGSILGDTLALTSRAEANAADERRELEDAATAFDAAFREIFGGSAA